MNSVTYQKEEDRQHVQKLYNLMRLPEKENHRLLSSQIRSLKNDFLYLCFIKLDNALIFLLIKIFFLIENNCLQKFDN